MREQLRFDTHQEHLDRLDEAGQPLTLLGRAQQSMARWLRQPDTGEPDRTEFISTSLELDRRVRTLPLEVVDQDEPAVTTVGLPRKTYKALESDGTTVDTAWLQAHSNDRSVVGTAIRKSIQHARSATGQVARHQAWWLTYEDAATYRYNPFAYDPTEQFIFWTDEAQPVRLLNFSSPLRKAQVENVANTLTTASQLTNGHSREVVPHLLIHNAFRATPFRRSRTVEEAAGRAWLGRRFVEINGKSLEGSPGTAGQSWLSLLIQHELTHQFEAEVTTQRGVFEDYFHYVDDDGDRLVDRTVPRQADIARVHPHLRRSHPTRDYALTSAGEDLAVAAEEAPFGGQMDPIRRDAYLETIQRFVMTRDNRLAQDLGPGHPDYNRLSSPQLKDHPIAVSRNLPDMAIERLVGNSIQLPTIEALSHPLKLHVGARPHAARYLIDLVRSW